MTKSDADIFSRRPIVELRAKLSRLDVTSEAEIAGLEPFMEATIAAAMIIAHADGEADRSERRRVVSLFRANPLLRGFSGDDIAREIAGHAQSFALDHAAASALVAVLLEAGHPATTDFARALDPTVVILAAAGVTPPHRVVRALRDARRISAATVVFIASDAAAQSFAASGQGAPPTETLATLLPRIEAALEENEAAA